MAKNIKSELEKSYIKAIWSAHNHYVSAKADYDSVWGTYQDKERMRKSMREMGRLRYELDKLRYKNALTQIG